MADMVPAVIAWVNRVRELQAQGEAVQVFEIHQCPGGRYGIVIPEGFTRRPDLRYCDCPGVEAWHVAVEDVFAAHGLEAVAVKMRSTPGARTRYDR